MTEKPRPEAIYEASPDLAAKLDDLHCEVTARFQWKDDVSRYEPAIVIGDKTTEKSIENSWQFIKVARKMLQRFQGPWPHGVYCLWPECAYRMSKEGGGDLRPKRIAEVLHKFSSPLLPFSQRRVFHWQQRPFQ